MTVESPFGFSAALVSVSAVPSNSSHNSVSISALLQNLWIISIWELLTCSKIPGMCQCVTPEEAIRSTIHLHIPLPLYKPVWAQSCWNSCAIYITYSMKLLLSDVLARLKPLDVRFNYLRKSDTHYLDFCVFFTQMRGLVVMKGSDLPGIEKVCTLTQLCSKT